MLEILECLAADNVWESGAWTLGSLIVMAWLLATIQDYIPRLWKKEIVADETVSPQKQVDQIVKHIASPRRTYEVSPSFASGDLCDVHKATSGNAEYLLKITRVPNGGQLLAKEFSLLELLQKQSGEEVYGEYFPEPAESFSHKKQHINAYTWRDGYYTAERILDRHHRGLDGKHLGWMFNRILEALGFVHQQGWIHGAILPPHLLFHAENHGLLLAGWIHAEKANTQLKVVPERFKDWYPPECRKKHPATPSVDIYLAAKSLIYLAGGDPVLNILPEHIPPKMARFIKGCLLESPAMRSNSAWEVRGEFGHILEALLRPSHISPSRIVLTERSRSWGEPDGPTNITEPEPRNCEKPIAPPLATMKTSANGGSRRAFTN